MESNRESEPVSLDIQDNYVELGNGIFQLTLSNPAGMITSVRYNGLDNLLEVLDDESNRGYWGIHWSQPGEQKGSFYSIIGTELKVIKEEEDIVEVSFNRTWDASQTEGHVVPLKIEKRYVVLRGCSGFYAYGIYEREAGWPGFGMSVNRIVFKLRKDKFHYMAISDSRQRVMPMPDDRKPPRGEVLAYKEAVLLVDPINAELKGEVDDKYQYSNDIKDIRVHGWVCSNPPTGFWLITPSDEFRTGGPLRQELTSHTGPTTLSVFVSGHYAGNELTPEFGEGEHWKKVSGPIFIYLNCTQQQKLVEKTLWEDAKTQMQSEVKKWPYDFPTSIDYPKAEERGSIAGRLLIRDRYVREHDIAASDAHVGLALPGEAGSWQRECKGYQFWTTTDDNGNFRINNVREGEYNIYAFSAGFVGDYKNEETVTITAGCDIDVGQLVYEPPRDGPTLWEIGIPDRSAAEFYVPDPDPRYVNRLYLNHPDKFRQYGLWEQYAELYPDDDLVYTIGKSNYSRDWFFAHVTRKSHDGSDSYLPTTWKIIFNLDSRQDGVYKLRIAIASASNAELQVRFGDPEVNPPHFTTGVIGKDNTIARHGIHGQYRLFHIDVQSSWLTDGNNTIFLTQANNQGPFPGILYDYIRLEEPQQEGARHIY